MKEITIPKWEYKIIRYEFKLFEKWRSEEKYKAKKEYIELLDADGSPVTATEFTTVNEIINDFGRKGWEIISMDGYSITMKRQSGYLTVTPHINQETAQEKENKRKFAENYFNAVSH